jgi:imidazolonepropionase
MLTIFLPVDAGYGLETETEMKMLRVIHDVTKEYSSKIDITATYLAHSVPKGKTAQEALADVLENQIPTLKKLKEKGSLLLQVILWSNLFSPPLLIYFLAC